MVLFYPHEGCAAEAGAQNRVGIPCGASGGDAVLRRAERAAGEPRKARRGRAEHCHAIFRKERNPLRLDGGCGHGRTGAQRRAKNIQLRRPGTKIRSVLDRGTIGIASGGGRGGGSKYSRGVSSCGLKRAGWQTPVRNRTVTS